MKTDDKKLGLLGLVAIIITSMIGGGMFNIPSDMARHSGIAAVAIGWLITGIGMVCLGLVFQHLSANRPELDGGVYSYARAGFGKLMGFSSAWGYWVSAFLGNVAYVLILFDTLSYFFPILENPLYEFIGSSIIIWGLYFIVYSGIKEAAIINTVTTFAKLIPLLIFIVIMCFFCNIENLKLDFWGDGIPNSLFEQIKETMLVTVWVFLGVEGAIVISSRAKNKKAVGHATIIGLFFTMFLYIIVTFITLAAIPREVVVAMPNPSLAYALEFLIGKCGAIIVSIGLIISIVGSLLGWTILAIEVPYIAAKDKVMPEIFLKKNKNETPSFSLLFTTISVHIFIALSMLFSETYQSIYIIASAAILLPYLLSALYDLKVVLCGKSKNNKFIFKDFCIASIASIYAIWLLYAAAEHLLPCSILYAIGICLFIIGKPKEQEKFTKMEWFIASAILIVACVSIVLMLQNSPSLT